MKTLLSLLLTCVGISATAQTNVTPGLPISRYPRVTSMDAPDIFIIARTNITPATNMGVPFLILSNDIAASLATTNYVNAATNNLFQPFELETLTNGVRLAIGTNQNWVSYVTGQLSGTTVLLGVDALAISNAFGISGFNAFRTNQFTTNVADVANNIQTPVSGALWFTGTNAPANLTNGARVGLEWWPFANALRAGVVFGNGTPAINVGVSSNFWDQTNLGPISVGFGSNNVNKGYASSVLGGYNNAIGTNTWFNVIGGGQRNFFQGAATNSVIGGGTNNNMGLDTIANTISGGQDGVIAQYGRWNAIAGGYQNRVGVSVGIQHDANTLGGFSNDSDGDYNTVFGINNAATGKGGTVAGIGANGRIAIAGGEENVAYGGHNFIGAGYANVIGGSSIGGTNSVIAGGSRNVIGSATSGNGFCFIGGGRSNSITTFEFGSVVVGGANNTSGGGVATFNFIGGGAGNLAGNNSHFGVVVGGANNSMFGTFGGILGGNSNSVTSTGTNSFIIGERQTNSIHHTTQIGYFQGGANTNYISIDTNSVRFAGNMGSFYPSNNAPIFPTAAKLGAGGYWVGNSNGNLVALYSLDGTTTAMKVLVP